MLAASDRLLDERDAAFAAGDKAKVAVAEAEFDRIAVILSTVEFAISNEQTLNLNALAARLQESIEAQRAIGLSTAATTLGALVGRIRSSLPTTTPPARPTRPDRQQPQILEPPLDPSTVVPPAPPPPPVRDVSDDGKKPVVAPSPAAQTDKVEYVVWYGTNRRPNDPKDASKGYSAARDNVVHYGSCRVFIPESHKIGSIGSPWWKRLLAMTDDRLRVLSIDEFERGAY